MPNPVLIRRLPNKQIGLRLGLLAYYKLDDTTTGNGFVWLDATGNGLGATQHGNNVQSDAVLFKIIGSAKEGAGGNSGMVVSSAIDSRGTTTPFSVSLWCYDKGNSFGDNVISNDSVTNRNWGLYMGDSSGGSGGANFVSLQTWRTTSGTFDGPITAPSACHTNSAFDHVVFGYDGANRFLVFNNGTRVVSAVPSVARGGVALTLMVRGDFLANFAGNLDEVGYWNRALSAAEISRLYNGGNGLPFSSF